jgi:hypothetical protein
MRPPLSYGRSHERCANYTISYEIALARIRPGIQTPDSRVTPLFANIHFVGCLQHVAGVGSNKTNPIRYE